MWRRWSSRSSGAGCNALSTSGSRSRELGAAIAAERALEDGDSTTAAEAGCQELLDQAAASLREQLVACGYPADLALTIEVAAGGDQRVHEDGRVSATLSPADLSRRVRLQGLRIDRGTAEMFLAWWLTTGLVEEVLPGQYRLTDEGQRVAGGLLAAGDGEVA